jgi:hypothetical protein
VLERGREQCLAIHDALTGRGWRERNSSTSKARSADLLPADTGPASYLDGTARIVDDLT